MKMTRLFALLVGLLYSQIPVQAKPTFTKTTYVYKKVDDVSIHLDVHRLNDDKQRPTLVWIHGGALIVGSRRSVPRQLLQLAQKNGYALVSIDYRLAPEVKVPAIIQDLEDAFIWMREKGTKIAHLDTKRLVVSGGSAGGYLTLMSGVRVKPRPTALVAFWGYGDVDGTWYTKPSPFYRKQPLIDKKDAESAVGKSVLTETTRANGRKRGMYYRYLRQNGLWTKVVTGFDPKDRDKLTPYCPVRVAPKDYPPTLMIHGTEDNDVPYELSAAMAKRLAKTKVPHQLITVKGAGHGLARGDRKAVRAAYQQALDFIQKHLGQ